MARYRYPRDGNGFTKDQNGRILISTTVVCYLTSTATPAKIYAASAGGVAIYSVTSSATDGSFAFWVDDSDYPSTQFFDITLTKTNYKTVISASVAIIAGQTIAVPGTTVVGDIVLWNDTIGNTLSDSGIKTSTDGTLAANSNTLLPTQQAVKTYAIPLTYMDTDVTLAANSDSKIASQKATKTFVLASIPASSSIDLADNMKFVVNASVNKLDIFTKSGGAVPDNTNYPTISIPDGTGLVKRTRKAAYLSGTSQFIMADGANYWSKGSLDAEIKTAYVYAIWDANGGIVWALGGYSGFTRVPASTTATDDDFFLLEASSTYTKVITDYCVCVGKIRYQYDTADTPDHTIQATVLDAPQVIWNPKSDYGKKATLATTVISGSDIADYSAVSFICKQSGLFLLYGTMSFYVASTGSYQQGKMKIKYGNPTYGSATLVGEQDNSMASGIGNSQDIFPPTRVLVNAGDTIHLGCGVYGTAANRYLNGDDTLTGGTSLFLTAA